MIVQNESIFDAILDWMAKPKRPPVVRVATRMEPKLPPIRPAAPASEIKIDMPAAPTKSASRVFSRDEALTDVLTNRKKPIPSQKVLAQRWGVTKGATSKWLARWEAEGLIQREASGRFKTVRAI